MKQAFKNKAYVAYLTVGDGGLDYSVDIALAYGKGGVDIIEIGIPFTDPVADGPTIQKAMDRSLNAGTTPETVIEFVDRFKAQSNIPLVIFSYYNPILQMGPKYLKLLKDKGVEAAIFVDVPYTEVNLLEGAMESIPVITPSSTSQRIRECTQNVGSFVYYACQKGTTGTRNDIPDKAVDDIQNIQSMTSTPVVAGFGISNREMAKKVLDTADGFVVGSHFVNAMEEKISPKDMVDLVISIDPRSS